MQNQGIGPVVEQAVTLQGETGVAESGYCGKHSPPNPFPKGIAGVNKNTGQQERTDPFHDKGEFDDDAQGCQKVFLGRVPHAC